ncbi:MAG: YdcF family protein [Alphaproteobacteria bacterium]|nr:YdcF family protein [Alphaproteobacteria bacterium]
MKNLSAAFLKAVGDYMLVETPLARADVCLVFGNPHADHLAAQAAELYHRGYFSLIVVSGGVATDDGRLEAHRMRDVLLARGVPAEIIMVEDKARNCGENVVYSMALLDEKKGLANIGSVLAIGHVHASRRFLMTLERHWPQVAKMFVGGNCFGVPKELWHTHSEFRAKVLSEFDKIPDYKAKGFIQEIDLEKIQQEASRRPKPPGSRPPAP